jgi:hypothetical protein
MMATIRSRRRHRPDNPTERPFGGMEEDIRALFHTYAAQRGGIGRYHSEADRLAVVARRR